MNEYNIISIIIVIILIITLSITLVLSSDTIQKTFYITKNTTVDINGVNYSIEYKKSEFYKCISIDNLTFKNINCIPSKSKEAILTKTKLDEKIKETITTTKIIVDKNKLVSINNQIYQFNYDSQAINNCICEIPTGCKIKQCV